MIVSLNTATGLNSYSGKAQANNRQGSARLSAPICDSVAFEGSEAKNPMKSFFKKAGMVLAMGTAALGFTSCDPTNGPDVPDIKPPVVTVDPNAGLNPLQKLFKNTFSPVAALDSTEVGAIHQVKFNDGVSGQDIEYIVDEAKSTADTIFTNKTTFTKDFNEGTLPVKFFKGTDGALTSKTYFPDGELIAVRKYVKQGASVLQTEIGYSGGYKYVPDKVVGQSLKYNISNPTVSDVVKLISKTMRKV